MMCVFAFLVAETLAKRPSSAVPNCDRSVIVSVGSPGHLLTSLTAKRPYDVDEVIATYKRLIHAMPRANQYLLLYVLDLLSVFARKSDKNRMDAASTPYPCLSS